MESSYSSTGFKAGANIDFLTSFSVFKLCFHLYKSSTIAYILPLPNTIESEIILLTLKGFLGPCRYSEYAKHNYKVQKTFLENNSMPLLNPTNHPDLNSYIESLQQYDSLQLSELHQDQRWFLLLSKSCRKLAQTNSIFP